jgi:hypothetical protein
LANKDIIRLLEGDIAPALIERINFKKQGKKAAQFMNSEKWE